MLYYLLTYDMFLKYYCAACFAIGQIEMFCDKLNSTDTGFFFFLLSLCDTVVIYRSRLLYSWYEFLLIKECINISFLFHLMLILLNLCFHLNISIGFVMEDGS